MSELRVGSSPSPIALLLVAIAILGAWVFLSGKKSSSASTTSFTQQASQNTHEEKIDKKSTREKSSERHSRTREDEEDDEPSSAAPTTPGTPVSATSETATTPPASAVDTEGEDRPRSKVRRKSRAVVNVAPKTLLDEGDVDARPDRAQSPISVRGEGGRPLSAVGAGAGRITEWSSWTTTNGRGGMTISKNGECQALTTTLLGGWISPARPSTQSSRAGHWGVHLSGITSWPRWR